MCASDAGRTVIYVAVDHQVAGIIAIADYLSPKPTNIVSIC